MYYNWIQRKGKMGGKGFLTTFSKAKQHKTIDNCVKEHGYRSCLGSIMVLSRNKKYINKKYGPEINDLKKYIMKKYSKKKRAGSKKKRSTKKRSTKRRMSSRFGRYSFASRSRTELPDPRFRSYISRKNQLEEKDLIKQFKNSLKKKGKTYYSVKNIKKFDEDF